MRINRVQSMVLALLAGASLMAAVAGAQQASREDWCRDQSWGRDRQGVCEVREMTVAGGANELKVDAAPNGGIRVQGSSRGDILVLARVVATAETESRAREVASAVRIEATPYQVQARGPDLTGRESWHVSYRLEVPTQTSLSLNTTNGGISITDVEGKLEFQTVNGGVKLSGLAGEVRGRTNNGGVDVELDGATWRGEGLDVQTNNGGVRLRIPENYSARLESGTVNGGFSIDLPGVVQGGQGRRDREVTADLGGGGPLIRVRTSNGGVKISKRD